MSTENIKPAKEKLDSVVLRTAIIQRRKRGVI